MTAIIAAMSKEVELIREKVVGAKSQTVCGMECVSGKIGANDVVVIKSGIGKSAAAAASAVAISVFGADKVINTGLAAGKFPIGTVVVADRCVQYDFDMTAEGLPMGQSCDFGSPYFAADETLSKRLTEALGRGKVKYEIATVASGDAFVADAAKMDAICRDFGARCVEMESGSVAQVCFSAGVPFAVLRAVSDGGDSVTDYETFSNAVCRTFASAILTYLGCDRAE